MPMRVNQIMATDAPTMRPTRGSGRLSGLLGWFFLGGAQWVGSRAQTLHAGCREGCDQSVFQKSFLKDWGTTGDSGSGLFTPNPTPNPPRDPDSRPIYSRSPMVLGKHCMAKKITVTAHVGRVSHT